MMNSVIVVFLYAMPGFGLTTGPKLTAAFPLSNSSSVGRYPVGLIIASRLLCKLGQRTFCRSDSSEPCADLRAVALLQPYRSAIDVRTAGTYTASAIGTKQLDDRGMSSVAR